MKKNITEYFTKKLGSNFFYFEKAYDIAELFDATCITNNQLNDSELVKILKLYKLIKNKTNKIIINQYLMCYTLAYRKVYNNEIIIGETVDCNNYYESDTFLYGSILIALKSYFNEYISDNQESMIISKITELISEYYNFSFEITTFDNRVIHN